MFEEVDGEEASSYYWSNPSPIVGDPLDHFEHVRQQAGVIAGVQTLTRALDHRFTRWTGAAYDDATLVRQSGWLSGEWGPNTFPGVAGLVSGPREVCVRTEHTSPLGRPHFLYHPWVPAIFISPEIELLPLGYAAWITAAAAFQTELVWASEALPGSSSVAVAPSLSLVTNNHRRTPVPEGDTPL